MIITDAFDDNKGVVLVEFEADIRMNCDTKYLTFEIYYREDDIVYSILDTIENNVTIFITDWDNEFKDFEIC